MNKKSLLPELGQLLQLHKLCRNTEAVLLQTDYMVGIVLCSLLKLYQQLCSFHPTKNLVCETISFHVQPSLLG